MPTKITKDSFYFLSTLKNNNNRDWFQAHKDAYEQSKENFETFVAELIEGLSSIDKDYALLEAKKCVFRIYRDIRFSKDKTPYKTHWAAGLSKGGKRVHIPGFYLHVEPGLSYFGGGIWHPDKEKLAAIRQEIDYNLEAFEQLLQQIQKQGFFEPMADEEALKRAPKGYAEDNQGIQYLKMRNFLLGTPISDELILSAESHEFILKRAKAMMPFLNFLQRALD